MFNYFLTESEVFMRKYQTQTLPYYGKAEVWDALSFKPAVDPWALRENNVQELLESANQIIGYKLKLYNKSTL